MTVTTENIIQTGEPSRTAWRVATLRAVHQLLDEPVVLDDPIALPILGAEFEAELREDPYAYNEPLARGLRAALVVRSRVAEDELARAVDAGVRQYVVLGAGLDTFAYRNPHHGVDLRVFEVDHPSTQQWKRRCLHEAEIASPESLVFAPVDFERGTLAQGLADVGFRSDQPACFSWLGVTMYLTETAIMETLGFVAQRPKGSSICFDYRVPEAMLNPIQRVIGEVMGQRAAAVGEPWISAFDPAVLQKQLLELGFSEAETYDPDTLNLRYLYRRKDGLRTGGRVMCARV
ncbi:class I SAM-dependent methyltransferase [Dyella caseinilytica]|uniref:S-adenosyl-L-methionine-dependent methyltransferase n=1 Tax=Dyella caseinilytica TaxID=1849581 RepID=A0ABX7GWI4_9GAMM|nr:class I SAM-dependent methyltransferase [Dyella caseinilytica]QRN54629.1 class I SAM-dependent methyltransferase [Dyella caseinilytica]GFZ95635.1 S-adenosyl-L-methionine-dependent methyltransferase [Dyella caseinilytica]